MEAIYYTQSKTLVLGNRVRVFSEVPQMEDFNEYPAVKNFLSSPAVRVKGITKTTVLNQKF